MSAEISNLVVQVFSRYTGRGPTKARTVFGDDLATVLLEETLTPAERGLVARGHDALVLRTRQALQELMHDDLVSGVEAILERRVIACLGADRVNPCISIEMFILAPEGDQDHDRPPYEELTGRPACEEPLARLLGSGENESTPQQRAASPVHTASATG